MARFPSVGMQCPACGEYENVVVTTKMDIVRNIKNRVRVCVRCGAKMPTVERIDTVKFKQMNQQRRTHNV